MKTTKFAFIFAVSIGSLVVACRKEIDPMPTLNDYRDSVYYHTRQVYFWNDRLPSLADFGTTAFKEPFSIIEKVRTFSPLNANNKNIDRWSYAQMIDNYQNIQAGRVTGRFGFGWQPINDSTIVLFDIWPNSPFEKAGVSRGWQWLKTNNITYSAANQTAFLNEIDNNNTVTFTLLDTDKNIKELTLTRADFTTSAIHKQRIIDLNGKKVGYIELSEFTQQGAFNISNTFYNYLAPAGIQDLILDLRYNGGGLVSVSQQLGSLIAPKTAKDQVFVKLLHNAGNAKSDQVFNFQDLSGLNLSRVFIITSGSTASASEAVINALKPFMKVYLIGQQTHGKPMGMEPFIVKPYIVSPITFKTVNAKNEGEYYDGFAPDYLDIDDISHDFGDPKEACVSDALYFIQNGTMPPSKKRIGVSEVQTYNDETPRITGMFTEIRKN